MIAALRERDWEGDDVLADQLDALLGSGAMPDLRPLGRIGGGGMSEYQYYEFLALDRPLTGKKRAELRSLSTRVEITVTRFVNQAA